MAFRIRPASTSDVPAMHSVRLRVRENRLSNPGLVTLQSYSAYVEAGSAWVAETEAGLAGFAAIDAARASVWALFVAPEAESRGIGQALHRHMLEWARQRGMTRLSLSTAEGSRAVLFYEKAGWSRAGATANGEAVFERLL